MGLPGRLTLRLPSRFKPAIKRTFRTLALYPGPSSLGRMIMPAMNRRTRRQTSFLRSIGDSVLSLPFVFPLDTACYAILKALAGRVREGLHKARFASRTRQVTGNCCQWGSSSPVFAPEPAPRRPSWPVCVLTGAHSGTRRPTLPAGCAVPSRVSRAQTASPGATRSAPAPGTAPSRGRTAA